LEDINQRKADSKEKKKAKAAREALREIKKFDNDKRKLEAAPQQV
jgi:hypothetical protein